MALSTQPKMVTNGILLFTNGSGQTLTAVTDEGDFKATGIGRRLNASIQVTRRGRRMGAGYGERRFVEISFSEKIMSMTAAAAPGSIRDFINFQGPYLGALSTGPLGQPPLVHVQYTAQDNSGATSDVLIFQHCDFNGYDFTEGEPDMFADGAVVTGDVLLNGTVIATEIGVGGT